jgi:hypothetical protein
MSDLKTPVALLIYNRPDFTKQVFETVRKVKPNRLFVIADGPKDKEDEIRCNEARAVIETINWNCRVYTNYSEVNLGCKERVSSGLDWVFSNVEKAIILEDDCLPSNSFFYYCDELLKKFYNESKILHISGSNFLNGKLNFDPSYYFSIYPTIWGWASWAKAWEGYDVNIDKWPELRESNWLKDILIDDLKVIRWTQIFDNIYDKFADTWDYQLQFNIWYNNGLSITPVKNLVKNIGFGRDSTHNLSENSFLSSIPNFELKFPLNHNDIIEADKLADDITFKNVHGLGLYPQKDSILKRVLSIISLSYNS